MNSRTANRRKFIGYAALSGLALIGASIPVAQQVVVAGLNDVVEITERIVRIPCWLLDHENRFSLDRLDPTCPQCM
jgi:hypothetical protein